MPIRETMKTALRSKYAPWVAAALAVVLIAVLAILAHYLGWTRSLLGSPWFWLTILLVIAAAVFAAVRWAVPWLAERSFLRKEGSEYLAGREESPQEVRAKFQKALRTLSGLPQLRGKDDPLYALPWCLLLGATQSGKTAALTAAELFSPLLPSGGAAGPTQNFDWWVSNNTIIVDTAGRYAFPVDMARDRAEWYRLLRLLRHYRREGAIDGLLIAIGADVLFSQSEEKLRGEATKLRERVEEAVRELGVDFPVTVLVTKCDLIEGFSEFFGELPERVRDEALGYVDDQAARGLPVGRPAARGAEALGRLSAGLESLYDRLHLFRIAILDGKAPEELKHAIFCFPEEVRALAAPLAAFVEPLIGEDVRYHTPLFRGVFFTSAEQSGVRFSSLRRTLGLSGEDEPRAGGRKGYFLRDLFNTLLPRDRGLASTTAREKGSRGIKRGLGLAGCAGAVLAAAGLLAQGYRVDRSIATGVGAVPCLESASRSRRQLLDEADRCRQAVQGLVERNEKRPATSKLLFRRSLAREKDLKQVYVKQFRAKVLGPLNSDLKDAFEKGANPCRLMVLVARRIELGERHAAGPAGGSGPEPEGGESLPLDYGVMWSPAGDRKWSSEEAAKARSTYDSFLTWQRGAREELREGISEDQALLRDWLSQANRFTRDRLVQLDDMGSSAISYETYWKQPEPLTGSPSPRIGAGCTKDEWEPQIACLQKIQDANPAVARELGAIEGEYREKCLDQWKRFLAGFPQGERRWQGADRWKLASMLLADDSPYERVLGDALTHLGPWIPKEATEKATPHAWAALLLEYAGSQQRKDFRDALKKISQRVGRGASPEVAEACFELAKDTLKEEKQAEPTEAPATPLLRAWWISSNSFPEPAGTGASGGSGAGAAAEENVIGPIVREPIRSLWRAILYQAGLHVQAKWKEKVSDPLEGLPAAEKVARLYGPDGKVGDFVEQFVAPFLDAEKLAPQKDKLLKEAIPLSSGFVAVLANAKQLKTAFGGEGTVDVAAGGPSRVEGGGALVEDETVLTIACKDSYTVTNRPRDPAGARASVRWTYQGCKDVKVTIFFADRGLSPGGGASPGGMRPRLTKLYAGQTGFLAFLQEFAAGPRGTRRFLVSEFPQDDPGAEGVRNDGVEAVTVSYKVEVRSPTLKKLVSTLQEAPRAVPSVVSSAPET